MWFGDNVRETSTTEGAGPFTLDGAVVTFRTFLDGVGNGKLTPYFIRQRATNGWEYGLGTLSGGDSLDRTLVMGSSEETDPPTAVDFAAGVKDVYGSVPADFISGATLLKKPCRVSTTANVTISTALNAGDTVNGVVLAAGDRVWVPYQTDATEIGIWIAGATPVRAPDFYTGAAVAGAVVPVQSGTLYSGQYWHVKNAIGSDVVGTASLSVERGFASNASQITNDSTSAGTTGATVADAVDWLYANKQPLDARLTALAALNSTPGLLAQTGASAFAKRTLTLGSAKLSGSNLDGSAGNPTIDFGSVAASDLSNGVSGSGAVALVSTPTLITPVLGVASATSINKVALTQPATGSTLTIANGKTLTASNTLTLAGTDGSTLNVGAGGTLAALAFKASVDLSTSDATGTLAAARMPALTGDITTSAGAVATTLASIVSAAGPIGDSATVPVVTIDAKGRVTALSSAAIAIEGATLTDVTTNNRSTTKHGFAAKFDGTATHFEDMTGSQRALAATDLGTTMQIQVANIGLNTAVDTTYKITADGGASNCLGNFSTTGAATQAGFNLGYSGQAFRIAANGGFSGFVITDVTAGAARLKIDTSGNVAVGNTGTILGKFEVRATTANQLAVAYDASNYTTFTISSAGILTITGNGSSKGIVFTDGIVIGSSSGRAKVQGVAKTVATTSSNSAGTETNLHSYTVPAAALASDGDCLRFTMAFTTAGNANTKTIKVKFGSTTIFDNGGFAGIPGPDHVISGVIMRTGATAQIAACWGGGPAAIPLIADETAPAETLSGSVTLKATGQTTTAGDIVQVMTVIEYLPANP